MTMTAAGAKSAITVSLILTGGSTEIAHIAHGKSLVDPLIATAGLGVFLFAIGTVSPPIAGGFATVAAITAVLVNGESLFRTIGRPATSDPRAAAGHAVTAATADVITGALF